MIFSGNKSKRLRLVGAWVTGLICGMLKMAPTPACNPDQPCAADAIDGFFLPLITGSLGDPGYVAALPLPPATAPTPSPLPPAGGAVMIKPPLPVSTTPTSDSPPSSPDTVVPVQRILIGQTLFAWALRDGGDVDMFTEMLPFIDGAPYPLTGQVTPWELDLALDENDHDRLMMQQVVALPTGKI